MSDEQIVMKSSFRKKLYSIINNLEKSEISRQSDIVADKVLKSAEFQNANVVSIYLSMNNEIQTERLLKEIFKEGKECFIPRFHAGCITMEMIRLSSYEQYKTLPMNRWNIKQFPEEVVAENVFERGQLDLVLTPGLGFTLQGLRLGRGKGYYDRFFNKCKSELMRFPFTMGLAFKEQILPDLPTEPHDFRLNSVVVPE